MKIQSAILALAAAVLLAACAKPFYSTVRMKMPGDYLISTVQKTESERDCRATSKNYINSVQASCPNCKLESFSCGTTLGRDEKALWSDDPIPNYSVSAGETRVLLIGAEQVTKPVCDQLVRDIAAKGMSATCVPPGQPRK